MGGLLNEENQLMNYFKQIGDGIKSKDYNVFMDKYFYQIKKLCDI